MTAKEIAFVWGKKLIGRKIHTQRYGAYPGGIATVIELTPDHDCPEIVLQVKHPTFGEIGVFDHEEVALV